uniref:Uncharacterized protein n=1 Tax=Rhizophora mucronata TaxID=61149 RepID=A0A2P2NKS9_RHIMU
MVMDGSSIITVESFPVL